MRRRILRIAAPVSFLLVLAAVGATQFRLSALAPPGAVETRVATAAKRWFVRRGAGSVHLPVVVDDTESVGRGELTYRTT